MFLWHNLAYFWIIISNYLINKFQNLSFEKSIILYWGLQFFFYFRFFGWNYEYKIIIVGNFEEKTFFSANLQNKPLLSITLLKMIFLTQKVKKCYTDSMILTRFFIFLIKWLAFFWKNINIVGYFRRKDIFQSPDLKKKMFSCCFPLNHKICHQTS